MTKKLDELAASVQIGNRIKSKGLQKLRWYCQMCQKQCRDENGFKCHLTSESHKRQMMVFGENPDRGPPPPLPSGQRTRRLITPIPWFQNAHLSKQGHGHASVDETP